MSNLSIAEHIAYDISRMRKWDWENALEYAKKKAAEQGLQEGRAQGLERGLAQGLERGKKDKIKEQQRIARSLKEQGVAIDVISKATGLSVSAVKKL